MNTSYATRALGALGAAVLCASASFAQSAAVTNAGRPQGVAGYLDPATGVFTSTPVSAATLPPDPYAASTVSGVYKFVMTITLKSSVPTTSKIECTGNLSAVAGGGASYFEQKSYLATRTGNTATCTVAIPYSWLLASAASTLVSIGYGASTVPAGVAETLQMRNHTANIGSIPLPANGATTTRTVAITL